MLLEHRTFDEAFLMCHALGLSMTIPTNDEENMQLFNELLPSIENCSQSIWKVWIGISDLAKEGVWLDIHQQKQIEYKNFKPPYPFGGTKLNCGSMLDDGFWGDETCSERKCYACTQRPSDYLNLRGLCFQDEHQTRFYLDGYREERPLFRGFYDHIVFWEMKSRRWFIQNVHTNSTLVWFEVLHVYDYPLGLREWTTQDQVCGVPTDTKLALSLSACNSSHFMCSSGECISMDRRCNLRHDCADGSDEDSCEVVSLKAGYRRHLPPMDPSGLLLTVTPTILINRFVDVDDISMTVALQFRIILQWIDGRLNFRHLHTKKKTILTDSEMGRLWIPQYQLADVDGGRPEVLERVLSVSRASSPVFPDHNSVIMGQIISSVHFCITVMLIYKMVSFHLVHIYLCKSPILYHVVSLFFSLLSFPDWSYPGFNNSLVLDVEHLARFACTFELFLYPFDVQRCSFQLRLSAAYDENVQLSSTNRTVVYNGSPGLVMFNVQNIKIGPYDSEQYLVVEFELHRRQGMILLSTFLPSMLLLLVSWATLFVKLEALNVRAVMSLTTLLVLYTLSTNTSRLLPATTTIKLVDIWFLFIIVLLFCNIMIHIFVTEGDLGSLFRITNNPVRVVKVEPPTPHAKISKTIMFLRIYRVLLMPAIVLLFNIVFWVKCLIIL